jgi:antitoxin (DNA-binding transcriptional repressor) of toxin-antitoxin stability system
MSSHEDIMSRDGRHFACGSSAKTAESRAGLIYLISSDAMVRMSATEVARNFSSVINRVGAGEEIEILRNGAPVAELRAPAPPRGMSSAEWRTLVAGLPAVDDEFAYDVEEARSGLGPPAGKWPQS